MTFAPFDPRIVGGKVVTSKSSWPAQAFIQACYADDFYLPDLDVSTHKSSCVVFAGTLIDRTTIVTAASNLLTSFDFDYDVNSYSFPIKANAYYRTTESMYKVFLGNILSGIGIRFPIGKRAYKFINKTIQQACRI